VWTSVQCLSTEVVFNHKFLSLLTCLCLDILLCELPSNHRYLSMHKCLCLWNLQFEVISNHGYLEHTEISMQESLIWSPVLLVILSIEVLSTHRFLNNPRCLCLHSPSLYTEFSVFSVRLCLKFHSSHIYI
jgi:hypothetical protein